MPEFTNVKNSFTYERSIWKSNSTFQSLSFRRPTSILKHPVMDNCEFDFINYPHPHVKNFLGRTAEIENSKRNHEGTGKKEQKVAPAPRKRAKYYLRKSCISLNYVRCYYFKNFRSYLLTSPNFNIIELVEAFWPIGKKITKKSEQEKHFRLTLHIFLQPTSSSS